ncbi:hypothetical protein ACFLIM_14510 [Nonomuraea sp. M3C6]|uniref:Uncharacterized protein n=1 Tax=Nonomuraea marmarensis TaxID=3351344 RepID=A0ABW7ADK4_9ACTN
MDRTQYLGYTPVTESRRLIANGLPEALPETLGGRHRFTPLSLHVGERIAAAAFARLDDVGSFRLDVWLLSQARAGRWHVRSGSTTAADPGDEDVLAPRPAAAVLDGHAQAGESTRYDTRSSRWIPWPPKWLAFCLVRLSAEVGAVRVDGAEIRVPEHGLQALAWWPDRNGTSVELLDHKGERISTLSLR